MNIPETEAKVILSKYSINVPMGYQVNRRDNAVEIFNKINKEVVIKPLGIKKRGKANSVYFAENAKDAQEIVSKMMDTVINKKLIHNVIIEEKISIDKEIYLAITIDMSIGKPILVMSEEGGIDIEDIQCNTPEKIKRITIDKPKGLNLDEIMNYISTMPISQKPILLDVIKSMYNVFNDYDAELIEINPMAISKDKFIAVDALLIINDDSLGKHPNIKNNIIPEYKNEQERRMRENGWSYVELGGDIALVCSGAGLAMSTLDMIGQNGGNPANFSDLAQVDGDGLYKALDIISVKSGIKVILINLFAGLNRCDIMAEGIKHFVQSKGMKIPIVTRIIGNMEDEGNEILKSIGIDNMSDLEAATKYVVEISKGA